MPPDMAISMRHTKLKAEEAALLAGEINKPSWESRNEGIHERVSFEDTIWGFDLAGGVFYKTPLRITFVKPESRAEKAGIRPGDRLLKINDLDTSTLTIQQAHDIIVESGIHLKISVTSPEDEEDAYYCYEDPIVDGYDSEEERRLEEEKAKKRRICARVSHYWSLQWPWVSKRRLIYRESNCFMVPSKYEGARSDKYPPLPVMRYTDDIVLYNRDGNQDNKKRTPSLTEIKEKEKKSKQERIAISDITSDTDERATDDELAVNGDSNIPIIEETNDQQEVIEENPGTEEDAEKSSNHIVEITDENKNDNAHDLLSPIAENIEESNEETVEEEEEEEKIENDIVNDSYAHMNGDVNDDDLINEVLGKTNDSISRNDEDNILDSILSDEGQNLENSEANNER